MFELPNQSLQPHNQHKPNSPGVGAGYAEMQHPGFQVLADKMYARLTHANCKIDRDIFERFCERMLPVTFSDWMSNP